MKREVEGGLRDAFFNAEGAENAEKAKRGRLE
jgi:hypothetical protein